MNTPEAGVYRAHIRIGEERLLYHTHVEANREQHRGGIAPWLQQALSAGSIRRWSKRQLELLLSSASASVETRSLWLLLALAGYLYLIFAERAAAFSALERLITSFKPRRNRS